MSLALEQLQAHPRKLRKSLKTIAKGDVSPSSVHDLRTRTRKVEAMLKALQLDSRRNEKKLLKLVKPVRKAAGKVRDADVLTQFTARLQAAGENDCRVELLQHLGSERERFARKLQKTASQASPATSRLKRTSNWIDKKLKQDAKIQTWSSDAAALVLKLSSELRDWPNFNRANIHEFRIKAKQLRYALQMADPKNDRLIEQLRDVTDHIGEWHDWGELASRAGKQLDHRGCKLLQEIQSRVESKLAEALELANQFRTKMLSAGKSGRKRRSSANPNLVVLESVSSLAA